MHFCSTFRPPYLVYAAVCSIYRILDGWYDRIYKIHITGACLLDVNRCREKPIYSTKLTTIESYEPVGYYKQIKNRNEVYEKHVRFEINIYEEDDNIHNIRNEWMKLILLINPYLRQLIELNVSFDIEPVTAELFR